MSPPSLNISIYSNLIIVRNSLEINKNIREKSHFLLDKIEIPYYTAIKLANFLPYLYRGGTMTRYKSRTLTEAELEYMQILWTAEETHPDAVLEALHKRGRIVTGGTVRNVLITLMEKGYVTRKKIGNKFHYKAKVSEKMAKKSFVRDLLERAFNGSESNIVSTLLDVSKVSKREIEKIKQLITDYEEEK